MTPAEFHKRYQGWGKDVESITNNMNGRYSTSEQPKAITEGKKEGGD